MCEVSWLEFTKSGEVKTKRKAFKTEAAMQKFINKLVEKDNFYRILARSFSFV